MSSDPTNDRETTPSADDPYAMKEEPAAPRPTAGPGPSQPTAIWYVARRGGQREGPLTLDVIKQRVVAGSLMASDLVWREGMPAWIPVREVPEIAKLFTKPAGTSAPTPAGSPPAVPLPAATAGNDDWSSWPLLPPKIEAMLSSPKFFRTVGRTCAAASVLFAAGFVFLLLLALSGTIHWTVSSVLTWSLILALMFFVGEAAGAVLEKLARRDPPNETVRQP